MLRRGPGWELLSLMQMIGGVIRGGKDGEGKIGVQEPCLKDQEAADREARRMRDLKALDMNDLKRVLAPTQHHNIS